MTTIREVVTLENPILRTKAKKVTTFNASLRVLLDDMVATMKEENGVGLAAPQIAVSSRIIVVKDYDPDRDDDNDNNSDGKEKIYRLINPEIVKVSDEKVSGTEGCLSIPGFYGDVDRYTAVTVKGFNWQGKPVKIKAEGWLARIFQHEIDHLNGILFIDLATKVWKVKPEESAPLE